MKNFLKIIIFCSINFSYLNAQNFVLQRNLIWSDNKDNQIVTKFENCTFLPNGIPYYYEAIDLQTFIAYYNYNCVSTIDNIVFEDFFDVDIFKTVSNNEFSFENEIFYSGFDKYLVIKFMPFVNQNGQIKRVKSFEIKISFDSEKQKNHKQTYSYKENSVLKTGKWVKIAVTSAGAYKLTFSQIQSLGFSNPSSVRIFGNNEGMLPFMNNQYVADDLVELPLYKTNDFIVFYAEGASLWQYDKTNNYFYQTPNNYTDTAYLFVTDYNSGSDNSFPLLSQETNPQYTINSAIRVAKHEQDIVNLVRSGRMWLGEDFIFNKQQTFSFNIENVVTNQASKLIYAFAARSPVNSTMQVKYLNNIDEFTLAPFSGFDYNQYVDYKLVEKTYTPNSNKFEITFTYNSSAPSANAWIDYIILNAIVNLSYVDQLIFFNTNYIGSNNVSKFNISNATNNLIILDITNPQTPKQVQYSFSNGTISFTQKTDSIKKYIVFNPSNAQSPILSGSKIGTIENQNLHQIIPNTQMLIITDKSFISQANALAQIHQSNDSLICSVVDVDKIYNEFSSGMKDASAIRNFIKMTYIKSAYNLKYVLLMGDGTFNNKGKTTKNNPNFIPTYQSNSSFNIYNQGGLSFTTDDFYALLDQNEGESIGLLDIGIGRFPIKNSQEADLMVSKIKAYYDAKNFGNWQNIITILADDRDKESDNFVKDGESLSNILNNKFKFINIKKIYLDAYKQITSANGQEYPDAFNELNNRINMGTLIVNYLGHGSELRLSSEGLINKNSVNKWSNMDKLALFITGTCKFSRFDNSDANDDPTSAGEHLLLDNDGGAIALISTSRVTYAGSNLNLNSRFYEYMFGEINQKPLSIGDAYRISKNLTNDENKKIFVLLGDPAIRLNYARDKVILTKINDIDIDEFKDTVKAFSKIKIEGFVADKNSIILNNFNGKVIITLFDKKIDLKTLNNDGHGAMDYWNQFTILFKGTAKATNGQFSAEFKIPKDIFYNFGKAKFSFLAFDNKINATGYNNDITLGGVAQNYEIDTIAPIIKLFLNDTLFVNGGVSNPNPYIYAIIEDNSGINLSSANVGHDIIAYLDNDNQNIFTLNEYFETFPNNFKKGFIKYQFFNIPQGNHTLTLKAYDIYNNPAQKTLSFNVIDNTELKINRLYNYPNPFTTNTDFYFEHNKPNSNFDVFIQILSPSGKIIKTIHQQIISSGFRSQAINWDGKDDFGNRIAPGAYIYVLNVRTNDGKIIKKIEKLLILK